MTFNRLRVTLCAVSIAAFPGLAGAKTADPQVEQTAATEPPKVVSREIKEALRVAHLEAVKRAGGNPEDWALPEGFKVDTYPNDKDAYPIPLVNSTRKRNLLSNKHPSHVEVEVRVNEQGRGNRVQYVPEDSVLRGFFKQPLVQKIVGAAGVYGVARAKHYAPGVEAAAPVVLVTAHHLIFQRFKVSPHGWVLRANERLAGVRGTSSAKGK